MTETNQDPQQGDGTMVTDQVLRLRIGAARDDREEEFALPAGWTATVYPPRDREALTEDGVREAFQNPIDSEPISTAARGARHAVVLVDDFRRPTPAETLSLAVIDELEAAGLKREQISIILGNGAHRPMTRSEVRARLGSALDRASEAVSHDAFSDDVEYLGLTPAGTPVIVNRAAAEADFSVSISTVYPHPLLGWGGGAKMVLPGISHVSSIHYHHGRIKGGGWTCSPSRCGSRGDVEAAARLFGLNVSVCCAVNSRRELSGLCVGDPPKAHRRAVTLVKKIGDTPMNGASPDLVIANAYPLDGDATQHSKPHAPAKLFGCPVLIINDFADPSTYHGLYDGPLAPYRRRGMPPLPEQGDDQLMHTDVFMYCPQYGDGFVPQDSSWYCESDWDRLMAAMSRRFPEASVAVLPVAPLQIPRVD